MHSTRREFLIGLGVLVFAPKFDRWFRPLLIQSQGPMGYVAYRLDSGIWDVRYEILPSHPASFLADFPVVDLRSRLYDIAQEIGR